MSLYYLLPDSPVNAEFNHKYTPFRFYAGTLIKLAKELGTDIKVISYTAWQNRENKINSNDEELLKREHYLNELSDNPEYAKELEEMTNFTLFSSSENVPIKYYMLGEDIPEVTENDICVFGILNNRVMKVVTDTLEKNKIFIEKSKGYIYLNSDCELTNTAYVASSNPNSEFLCILRSGKTDPVFRDKLLAIVNTESPYDGYIKYLEYIFKVPVLFCPMILVPFQAGEYLLDQEFEVPTENSLRFLRGFERWTDYTKLFQYIKDNHIKCDWYESSLPANRKKFKPIMDEYGINYLMAQQWTFKKNLELLRTYKFISGLSLPTNHRMTYKIAESSLANRICILPTLCTEGMTDQHKREYETFSDIFWIENSYRDNTKEQIENSYIAALDHYTKMNESDYREALKRQKSFMVLYHGYHSLANDKSINNIVEVIK